MPTVSVTQTTEVVISPSLRKRLMIGLRAYAAMKVSYKALEAQMDAEKAKLEVLREETGEASLSLEGFSVTLVAPVRKKFNPKRFISLGGDLALYNNAVEDVTSCPYTKVTTPGSKEDE